MMHCPDAIRIVPIRDPIEWSFNPASQAAALPPFGADYVRTPDTRPRTYLVDGHTFDSSLAPEDQFRCRVDVSHARRYRTWSFWGWSIVLIWYGGAR